MNPTFPRARSRLLSIISVLLFLIGTLSTLALSMGFSWAELEAYIYTEQSSSNTLKLQCPLVLSPRETGAIRASINNVTDQDVKPLVASYLSGENRIQNDAQILFLSPGESKELEWSVNRSNIVFRRLILVNIAQSRYAKLDPQRGFCGILVFSLFGLNGQWSFGLALAICILLTIGGAVLWMRSHSYNDQESNKAISIGRVFAGLALAGIITASLRWWGLTILFDALALVTLVVGFTEFAISPNAASR